MDKVELFLFGTAALLFLCVLLSKGASKIGFPTLVIFLGVGALAGSEGIGGIYFDNAYYAKTLGIVALAYILFSGGLDTKLSSVRPVLRSGFSLATIGVVITMLFIAAFAHYFLNFSIEESLLIGAIISSTDAGAVFTVLRSRNIHLKGRLGSLLELESGSNDPMAVFLVTTILIVMKFDEPTPIMMIPKLIQQMVLGFGLGWGGGKFMAWGFNKIKLEIEGLYMVLSLAMVLLMYTTSQALGGNGFLTVYVAGVILGNESFLYKKTLIILHDGVSWLMQSSMFLTLGLLIFPSHVVKVTASGILVAAFMVLIARPVSVFVSLSFSTFNFREKLLISWVGLRGSVPIVMATYPMVAGVAKAEEIFNLVFFVSVTSLLVQGTTISFVAKKLGLLDEEAPFSQPMDSTVPGLLSNSTTYLTVPDNSDLVDKNIVELKLPPDLLIVLIERKGEVIIPRGATQLKARDKLMIVSQKDSLKVFRERISAPSLS